MPPADSSRREVVERSYRSFDRCAASHVETDGLIVSSGSILVYSSQTTIAIHRVSAERSKSILRKRGRNALDL